MSVLTPAQAEKLLAEIPPPTACDLCGFKLDERCVVNYGPFEVHLCPGCEWKWRKHKWRKHKATLTNEEGE